MRKVVEELLEKFGPPGQAKKICGQSKIFNPERIKTVLQGTEGLSQTEISRRMRGRNGNGPAFGAFLKEMVENGELERYRIPNPRHPKKISVTLYKLAKENNMNITEKEELVLSAIKKAGGIAKKEKIIALSGFTIQQVQGITNRLAYKRLIIKKGDAFAINNLQSFPVRGVEELKELLGVVPDELKAEMKKNEVPRESYVDNEKEIAKSQADSKPNESEKPAAKQKRELIDRYKLKIRASQRSDTIIEVEKLAAAIEVAESLRGYKDGYDKASEILRLLAVI
jgi:hypothetical protein